MKKDAAAKGNKVMLKGLHTVRSNGSVYYYAWRGGPSIKAKFGTEEFLEAFVEARKSVKKIPKSTIVSALAKKYQDAGDFGGRSAKWISEKKKFMEIIVEEFGEDDISLFEDARTRRDILELRDKLDATPRKADHVMGELSTFLSWCRNRGYVSKNIAEKIEKIGVVNRSNIIWEADEISAVCKKSSANIARVIQMAAHTGLARADLLALRWSDIDQNSIKVERQKTCQLAIIPIYDEVRTIIDDTPKIGPFVFTTSHKQPWSPDGFSTGFRRAKIDAKIDKRFHDLRGTAVTFFYSKGLSDEEVAEIVGWNLASVRDIKRRYVAREKVAQARIVQLNKNRT